MIFQGGFVKNETLLVEDSKTEDLLDISRYSASFKKTIDNLKEPSIVCLVGPFGSGKSTLLYQISKQASDDELWIEFDAWKYPERKNLWEGLILDFAQQMGERAKYIKRLEGKHPGVGAADLATDAVDMTLGALGAIMDGFKDVPGLSILDKIFKMAFEKSPATRIFDQQVIFQKLLQQEKKIYVVIEDVDRSGDAGVHFLETLSQFLKSASIKNKVVFIAPISDESYYKNINSYSKSVDYFEFYRKPKISLVKFVESVVKNEAFEKEWLINRGLSKGEDRKKQVVVFLEGLFQKFPGMSMRLLKLILRSANLAYKKQVDAGYAPDFRVTICIEASKYLNQRNEQKSFYEEFKMSKVVTRNNIFSAFLYMVMSNKIDLYMWGHEESEDAPFTEVPYDIKFTTRLNGDIELYPSTPWVFGHGGGYAMADFYMDD